MKYILVFFLFSLSSCWVFRAYKVRRLELTDHKRLPSVVISGSDHPYPFLDPVPGKTFFSMENEIDKLLAETKTAAFLVIRNDSLLYEKYFMGFDQASLLPSNSMAKSFTGTLVGIALKEGALKSLREPITNYLPALGESDARFHNITISHLLDMRSGLDFDEGRYNLCDDAVKLGFRPNLTKHLMKAKIKEAPGNFKYQSINTQLLGLIIEQATGQKLQDYFEEKLWKPMGTENSATWNVDSRKRKHILTSAGLNATVRDFAKIGRLYLDSGRAQQKQIINSAWVSTVANPDTMLKYEGYKNQWWNRRGSQFFKDSMALIKKRRGRRNIQPTPDRNSYFLVNQITAFNAFGFLEQIIYINPRKNLIIVRFGKSWPVPEKFTHFIYELGERL
ncbi:MAG: serine hydrolase domain-containing protein [Flavisolibacter sp.]